MAQWSALAMSVILPSIGCQVEYAGMTLPSGRYMHDDVQYFPSGPDFPWANTQAATQRARMRAMGIEPPPAGTVPAAAGALPGAQQGEGRPTDVNIAPVPPFPAGPGIPAPGPAPGGAVPPPAPGIPAPGPGGIPAPGGASNVPPPGF